MKRSFILVVIFGLFFNTIWSAPQYFISGLDITPLEANWKSIDSSEALQINDLGQVVGNYIGVSADDPLVNKHATFIWDNLTGFRTIHVGDYFKHFTHINNNGYVVGCIHPAGKKARTWYFWHENLGLVNRHEDVIVCSLNDNNSVLIIMGNLGGNDERVFHTDIQSVNNNLASAVIDPSKSPYSCIRNYFENIYQKLPHGLNCQYKFERLYITWLRPIAFNNQGHLLASVSLIASYDHPSYRAHQVRHTHYVRVDGSDVIELSGVPFAMNDLGEIAYSAGCCVPSAINNNGYIVGHWQQGSDSGAFMKNSQGFFSLRDCVINGEDWANLSHASDINDSGQIVGYGIRKGQTKHTAFLLSPVLPEGS